MRIRKSKVIAFFDTETTNMPDGSAFACAYILLAGDKVTIYRKSEQFLDAIDTLAEFSIQLGVTGIIGAYNLRFDLWTLRAELENIYQIDVFAKAPNKWYFVDVYPLGCSIDEEPPILRFWDLSAMEPSGLASIGKLCGVDKLEGKWNYSAIRGADTKLTEDEKAYAEADVRILDKFCEWIPAQYPWIKAGDLGRTCITSASILRLYQQRVIAPIKIGGENVGDDWRKVIDDGAPRGEHREKQREVRRGAYAGGLTFVNPAAIFRTYENVTHLDIDSAYHFALCNLSAPTNWHALENPPAKLVESLIGKAREAWSDLLKAEGDLLNPIGMHFHAQLTFTNIKKKEDMRTPAGYLSARRFDGTHARINPYGAHSGAGAADMLHQEFGKVISAKKLTLCVDEYELIGLCAAYDFDKIECNFIEIASKEQKPQFPRLSSIGLRAEKQRLKAEGGTAYDFFKRAYNSQAGVYAQAEKRQEEDAKGARDSGFSLAFLPLAIRVTALTRLLMLLACENTSKEAQILSGDTDSLKIAGDSASAVYWHSKRIERAAIGINDLEHALLSKIGAEKASIDHLGMFTCEEIAKLHREIAPKARAWINDKGTLQLRYAGMRSQQLEKALNEIAQRQGERAALDALKPWTWIDFELVKHVIANTPDWRESRRFAGIDRDGKAFTIKAYPAIALQDSMECIMNIGIAENVRRLKQAGLWEKCTEGYLSEEGWQSFDEIL